MRVGSGCNCKDRRLPSRFKEVRKLADGWGAALGWRGAGTEALGWEGGSKVRGSNRPFSGPDSKC